ncbi:putative non-specific serine/threonine protein kinase [Helianthus annuus]|uniref:Non-specific serine/threonine protein kinase n=1 Tax=Helianthus annuus TaxID=4232 RepID=A0A251S712_HELAN|nr:putative non-specific serine/threonine protein kinase [Helianthus annuus]KAJ0450556.1 putative non-specific serine/threonine protein kinase [Helianthus annuus]KAJ0454736.1 putative non-specific serine/threonine protein kinase [Helianthus annuus]KAJ0472406.1 putative non-specific serine/threonine protein kinase [Helianthus annuus]KAJ0648006.1 putative non-specific serine/threonine protein kinase [Helianthus annuus]
MFSKCLGKWFSKGTGGSRFTGFFHPALVLQRLSWSELLARASSKNDGNSFRSLLEAQNADGQTALHLACRRGSAELLEAILSYPEVNVDVLDKDGDPPLVFALAAGSPECVRALLSRYANVRSRLRDGFGPSVAHVCAYHGHPNCMRELLLAGADPNTIDDEGESVLHRAVTKKYTECALVILEHGGCKSMGILNSKNLTPLHLCVTTWNVAIVKRWIEVASSEEISETIDVPSRIFWILSCGKSASVEWYGPSNICASVIRDHTSSGFK